MKKAILILTLIVLVLTLTSCQVNWFDEKIDVPWYYIAVPVAGIFVAGYAILMSRTYVCPECGTEFKAKWYQLSVCIHMGGQRLAKCPVCGRKGFCDKKR